MNIKIALAGNPNSGKTTLFNLLTGSNQYVGNWPGVTVEKKEGKLKKHSNVTVTDLPGIYSLSPYTLEEVVARNYLIEENPDVILNIVDGTNLERNLYLTTQLVELGIPVVIAINMTDILRKKGEKIDINALSKKLGCSVVEISALKGTGISKVTDAALAVAENKGSLPVYKFSSSIEEALKKIEIPATQANKIPAERLRWYCVKVFERDSRVKEKLNFSDSAALNIEKEIKTVETILDDDSESIIINERYLFIEKILKDCYIKSNKGSMTTSDKIDRIVTNRIAALPLFALVMFLVYYISVTTVGSWTTDWVNDNLFGEGFSLFGQEIAGIPTLVEGGLNTIGCADWLVGLIVDGIVGGVGAVLGFLPQLFVLFMFLAILEGCGYMARIAFVMDKIFCKFGLSGKSFIPILIGTGCGVPGIMASRTIENQRDRRMTIITTTFIPCSAKLPIIALIASSMFGGAWWVAPSAYFAGIAAIITSGIMLKKTKLFSGEVAPFVMELPAYHLPAVSNVLRSMWERGWSFIKKAGTIILVSSILIWAGSAFGFQEGHFIFNPEMELENSIIGIIGSGICHIFAPLGFGNIKATIATIMGLVAKEEIVGVFGVLDFVGMTKLSAYSFLLFNLLCAPCFAAMGAIRREMNSGKWTMFAIGYQCAFAYAVSLVVYQFGMMFTGQGNILGTAVAVIITGIFVYMLLRQPYKGTRLTTRVKNVQL